MTIMSSVNVVSYKVLNLVGRSFTYIMTSNGPRIEP
jgi:hypothetical protein